MNSRRQHYQPPRVLSNCKPVHSMITNHSAAGLSVTQLLSSRQWSITWSSSTVLSRLSLILINQTLLSVPIQFHNRLLCHVILRSSHVLQLSKLRQLLWLQHQLVQLLIPQTIKFLSGFSLGLPFSSVLGAVSSASAISSWDNVEKKEKPKWPIETNENWWSRSCRARRERRYRRRFGRREKLNHGKKTYTWGGSNYMIQDIKSSWIIIIFKH